MTRQNWIAVASAKHVRIGRAAGFMQVGHGKQAPLKRIHPGDRVVYYSPTEVLGAKDKLQAFTAIGIAEPGAPYQADMAKGLKPFRRDVRWLTARAAPIRPLLEQLEFATAAPNWGARLRFGLFAFSDGDLQVIAAAMRARVSR